MIEKFIRYANILDRKGKYKEADRFDKLAFSNDDNFIVKIIKEQAFPSEDCPKCIFRDELVRWRDNVRNISGSEDTLMHSAYSLQDKYIGDQDDAKHLVENFGIIPETISEDKNVCSIGWSNDKNKFYGWSHRAIHGFGIGDDFLEIKPEECSCGCGSDCDCGSECSCGCNDKKKRLPDSDEAWSISQNKAQRRRRIKTLEEAKRAAINFAESVS